VNNKQKINEISERIKILIKEKPGYIGTLDYLRDISCLAEIIQVQSWWIFVFLILAVFTSALAFLVMKGIIW
jgi:hypothetical protein